MGYEEQDDGQRQILPDVLAADLRVVFCGSAVGTASARAGAYYAGPGNRFWDVLFHIHLTPYRLVPHEFRTLLDHGIGLTDLAKTVSGADQGLRRAHFDAAGLRRKVETFAPRVLAFNGKRAAQEFYGLRANYGRQAEGIGPTIVFVLPSTSGAARRYWDETCWQALADLVGPWPPGVAPPRER